MSIYFTADTHFCDMRVINRCNRPFDNIFAMNYSIIKRINCTVKESDDLYILGDVGKGDRIEWVVDLLSRIRCNLHLVIGNHDIECLANTDFCKLFKTISGDCSLKYNDVTFYLSHNFNTNWTASDSIHLYGHYHYPSRTQQFNPASIKMGAYNVGVDFHNFYPVNAEKLYLRAFADYYKQAA